MLNINVSDILPITDNTKYPYRNSQHYYDKDKSKANNPYNQDLRIVKQTFLTIQDIFNNNGSNFEQFIKSQVANSVSSIKTLNTIKAIYPICLNNKYDKYILKRFNVATGKYTENINTKKIINGAPPRIPIHHTYLIICYLDIQRIVC